MKYLFINGSPRKGNTWKLAIAAKEHIIGMDSASEFEEIHLSKQNLPFCTGCSTCFRLGHEYCPHSDIIMKIINAIDNADGIIFTSSTFNLRETALLKNLFDHLCFMLHRPHFFTSKALVITSTGGVGAKAAAKSIKSTLNGIGFNKCYMYSCSSYSWNNYKLNDADKKSLYKITNKFYKDVESHKLHSVKMLDIIPYNLFRGMSLSYVKGTEYETVDGEYYTDEPRKSTVYDSSVKVPFYLKPLGHLFYIIGKIAGKRITITYKK